MDFDPTLMSFGEILDLVWRSHNPFAAPRKAQYKSVIFWHDEKQESAIEETLAQLEIKHGAKVATEVRRFEVFHLAEDYHQKYILRRYPEHLTPLLELYPNSIDFINSTAAARLNSSLAGSR